MNMKNVKGVTLVSLTITIVVLLIIGNITIYSVANNLGVQYLKNMQNDIENLNDKVSNYYSKYGALPIIRDNEYTNIDDIEESGVISEEVDKGDFYVIDLSALENLTLNYGKDYQNVGTESNINNLEDIYIINDVSHNIFYVKGIELNNKTYYTNYTENNKDTEEVNLRYVDNVKIPDGYLYIEGNKESGIKIKKSDDATKIYEWIVLESSINSVPNGINVDDEEEFIESVNIYQGYYKNESDALDIIYLPIEEKWSSAYDKTAEYKDKNGDIATIPIGFQVSKTEGQDQINKGLVVRNSSTQDEYVWIPCTVSEYSKEADSDWEKINYTDKTWTDQQVTNIGEKSITKHGGFYVARYEAGIPEDLTEIYADSDGDIYNTSRNITTYAPVSKKGVQAWNFITQANAKTIAENMISESTAVQSYLMDSNAWNTICRKIEDIGKDINNSSSWGNYYDNTTTNYENINTLYAVHSYDNGKVLASTYSKKNIPTAIIPRGSGSNRLELSTGASRDFKAYNIYDLAGNMWEYTTETGTYSSTEYVSLRGGSFYWQGTDKSVTCVASDNTNLTDETVGFRAVLYLK